MSIDGEINMTGPITRVDYWQGFLRYKKLASNLSRIDAGRQTLKTWNDLVFKGMRASEFTESTERSDTFESMEAEIEARELLEQEDASNAVSSRSSTARDSVLGNNRSVNDSHTEEEGK